jgi:hypothetical protein
MSPLNNIRRSAICLNPIQGRAYEIILRAEKLPVWARRMTVPATACAAIAQADLRAREVLAFNASRKAR